MNFFGVLTDLVIASGCSGLRGSNPALETMIAGSTFPLGIVLIVIGNMCVMSFTWLQWKLALIDVIENWVLGYTGNLASALFVVGFLAWWTGTLSSDAKSAGAVTQAKESVNVSWRITFLRGIECNWFVTLAPFLSRARSAAYSFKLAAKIAGSGFQSGLLSC